MIFPESAIRHNAFIDVASKSFNCEEDAEVSDEELDISAKWISLNSKNFQKHPSKNYSY